MGAQPQLEPIPFDTKIPHWSVASRVAFRFCFTYFSLFSLSTQILGGLFPIPKVDIPDPATLAPMRQIVFWTAAHVFHVRQPLVYTGSGSGDKTFDWVLAFCLLVCAALVTVVWSILDRRRANYVALHKWLRLFIRFALGSEMILYGMVKAVPLAFGARDSWYTYGGARAKSPLYGIWNVDQISIDGQLRPPLLTDSDRWRRAIFDYPKGAAFVGRTPWSARVPLDPLFANEINSIRQRTR